jgi:hypothetical protein
MQKRGRPRVKRGETGLLAVVALFVVSLLLFVPSRLFPALEREYNVFSGDFWSSAQIASVTCFHTLLESSGYSANSYIYSEPWISRGLSSYYGIWDRPSVSPSEDTSVCSGTALMTWGREW